MWTVISIQDFETLTSKHCYKYYKQISSSNFVKIIIVAEIATQSDSCCE